MLGIRHHGPGSARAVLAELERVRPDAVLVEGPADADPLLPWVTHAGMQPPVALLAHVVGDADRSSFWPFAVFSPEWQAITWAVERDVTVRFHGPAVDRGPRAPAPGRRGGGQGR